MPMKADREELREDVDAVAAAVDAVADRDVDEAILARDGDRRLATQHGEGIKPRAAPAAEDETENFALHRRLPFTVGRPVCPASMLSDRGAAATNSMRLISHRCRANACVSTRANRYPVVAFGRRTLFTAETAEARLERRLANRRFSWLISSLDPATLTAPHLKGPIMIRSIVALLTVALFAQVALAQPAGGKARLYVGTYTGPKSKGIYLFATSTPPPASSSMRAWPASALTRRSSSSITTRSRSSMRSARSTTTSTQQEVRSRGRIQRRRRQRQAHAPPTASRPAARVRCYVAIDKAGKHVFAANYGSGSVECIPIAADGKLATPTSTSSSTRAPASIPATSRDRTHHSINSSIRRTSSRSRPISAPTCSTSTSSTRPPAR